MDSYPQKTDCLRKVYVTTVEFTELDLSRYKGIRVYLELQDECAVHSKMILVFLRKVRKTALPLEQVWK